MRTGIIFGLFLFLSSQNVYSVDTKPQFQVAVTSLGPTGGTLQADAFAAQLCESNWCTAIVAPRPGRWNKCPDGVTQSEFVSVVLTGFGSQANAFVFMFDTPDRKST